MKSPVVHAVDRGPTDLSREQHAEARKLIEELKRLYGRMAECLDDTERRSDLWTQIGVKHAQITKFVSRPRG